MRCILKTLCICGIVIGGMSDCAGMVRDPFMKGKCSFDACMIGVCSVLDSHSAISQQDVFRAISGIDACRDFCSERQLDNWDVFLCPIGLLFSKQFKVAQKACEDYHISVMIKDMLPVVDKLLEKYDHSGELGLLSEFKKINVKSIEELRLNIKNNSTVFKKIGQYFLKLNSDME